MRRVTQGPYERNDCLRQMPDRRSRPTPMLSRYTFRGRRRGARRTEEAGGIYVDRYRADELMLVGLIFTASIVDLLATLAHLEAGGGEANPLWSSVIARAGITGFAFAKVFVTGIPLLFLLLHSRFDGARRGLGLLLFVHVLLLGWHVLVAFKRSGSGM